MTECEGQCEGQWARLDVKVDKFHGARSDYQGIEIVILTSRPYTYLMWAF